MAKLQKTRKKVDTFRFHLTVITAWVKAQKNTILNQSFQPSQPSHRLHPVFLVATTNTSPLWFIPRSPRLPNIPHHRQSTKIQRDHKETVWDRMADTDVIHVCARVYALCLWACVLECVCVCACVHLAIRLVESREKLSAVDMSLEVPL